MGERSFHDVIKRVASMAAVFIDPVFTASRCRVLVSRGRVHVADIVRYCLTPRTYFLVAVVIKEVVSWL